MVFDGAQNVQIQRDESLLQSEQFGKEQRFFFINPVKDRNYTILK